jgi:protocatechuate 3,4-dioxygenase beta subunit
MQRVTYFCSILVFSVVWWTAKPSLAETTAPANGVISGRVLTGNGEPLRRATVVVEEVKFADGSSETVGDATTGDNGEFSFSSLTPARYRLLAEKSGYVAGRFPRAKALVNLHSGDTIDGITLRMVPVSVVSGSVLDGNGDFLAKAVVRLLQYQYYPGGRRLTVVREAVSDERGEYRMGDLHPGRYYVVASYRSRISDVVCPPVYYPDVASFDDAMPIRLAPGDEAPVKFVLLAEKPLQVRGNVLGSGKGIVQVSLIPRGGVPYAQLLSVETSNGEFQFKKVLPGSYTVMAISRGKDKDEVLEGRAPIEVEDHDLNSVSVRLADRDSLRRLWVTVNSSSCLISSQESAISLHPAFRSSEDSIVAAEEDLATDHREISTRNGNPIELPSSGPFIVSAEKLPGDCFIEKVEYKEAMSGRQRIPGTTQLAVQLASHGASVEGLVVDSADQPLAGAVVVAVPHGASHHLIDQYRTTTTDQNGQFVLHGLAPTTYGLYAWEDVPDGAYYDSDYLAGHAGTALEISVAPRAHYPVKLHAASADEE